MKQRKDTNGSNDRSLALTTNANTWNTYEAILDNVHFEWDDHMQQGEQVCKQDCIEYLDRYFPDYKMTKFHLKREHQRFGSV